MPCHNFSFSKLRNKNKCDLTIKGMIILVCLFRAGVVLLFWLLLLFHFASTFTTFKSISHPEVSNESVSWTYHPVDREKLVASFQASVSVGDASRDDPWDVNRRVLLLSAHNIKTQAFFCLGQFHDTRVWVSLACCKSGHCSLQVRTLLLRLCKYTVLTDLLKKKQILVHETVTDVDLP